MGYYLPGFNRYVVEGRTVDECQSLCCENPWCTSFDYAEKGDGKTHGPKTCWLSSASEGLNGGGGLEWDPTNNYHYYEVTKRGSRFMTLTEKKGQTSRGQGPASLFFGGGRTKVKQVMVPLSLSLSLDSEGWDGLRMYMSLLLFAAFGNARPWGKWPLFSGLLWFLPCVTRLSLSGAGCGYSPHTVTLW